MSLPGVRSFKIESVPLKNISCDPNNIIRSELGSNEDVVFKAPPVGDEAYKKCEYSYIIIKSGILSGISCMCVHWIEPATSALSSMPLRYHHH